MVDDVYDLASGAVSLVEAEPARIGVSFTVAANSRPMTVS